MWLSPYGYSANNGELTLRLLPELDIRCSRVYLIIWHWSDLSRRLTSRGDGKDAKCDVASLWKL